VKARRTYWHSKSIDLGYPRDDKDEIRVRVPRHKANLVSSRLETPDDAWGNLHAPALDLDLPAELIPSSTPGHYHLLIDKPMSWLKYRALLRVMVWCGLVERKYYRHSVRRGMTMLRLPGVGKGEGWQLNRTFDLDL
jgi:hypothetical protein